MNIKRPLPVWFALHLILAITMNASEKALAFEMEPVDAKSPESLERFLVTYDAFVEILNEGVIVAGNKVIHGKIDASAQTLSGVVRPSVPLTNDEMTVLRERLQQRLMLRLVEMQERQVKELAKRLDQLKRVIETERDGVRRAILQRQFQNLLPPLEAGPQRTPPVRFNPVSS